MLAGIWTAITSRIAGYAAVVGAALAVLFAAYSKGKSDAATKRDRDRLNEIKKARDVENEVDRLGNDALDRELDRWMRHD